MPSPATATSHHHPLQCRAPPAPPPSSSPPPPPALSKPIPSGHHYNYSQKGANDHATLSVRQADPTPGSIQVPSSTFSAASLPRTSSLLPPTRPNVNHNIDSERDPDVFLHVSNSSSFFTTSVRDVESHRALRPCPSHSRSSSIGGASEGFRNLNRWSASTASSFASNVYPQSPAGATSASATAAACGSSSSNSGRRSSSYARRMSVDSTQFARHNTHSSPQSKLQKGSPPTANGSPTRPTPSTVKAGRSPCSASPSTLGPVITFPPLDSSTGEDQPPHAATSSVASSAGLDSRVDFWNEHPDQLDQSRRVDSGAGGQLLPAADITGPGLGTAMTDRNGQPNGSRMYIRQRSANKFSTDSSASRSKSRQQQPSQKQMLSRALQKANLAVQLDNQQNFEGARESYAEACDLLHHVLHRTNGEDDRQKLKAIRQTYTSRINELDQMLPADDKMLPARSHSGLNEQAGPASPGNDSEEPPAIEAAPTTRIAGDGRVSQQGARAAVCNDAAARQDSEFRADSSFEAGSGAVTHAEQNFLSSSFARSSAKDRNLDNLAPPRPIIYPKSMPTPLSPVRPLSLSKNSSPEPPVRADFSISTSRVAAPTATAAHGHARTTSHESISWLDPIDESGSASSSVHSPSSSVGLRRKNSYPRRDDTEAEFDAALDAAVEAAYDDGYEPTEPTGGTMETDYGQDDLVIANALRKVELAKEQVRQSEREVAELSEEREKRFNEVPEGGFYDGNDSDDEERMLEEITRRMAMEEEHTGGGQGPQSLSRESDSSVNTSRTRLTSVGSNPLASLSTVNETGSTSSFNKSLPPAPPPRGGLPALPPSVRAPDIGTGHQQQQQPAQQGEVQGHQTHKSQKSLQTRRLSYQNTKQLKIETQRMGGEVSGQARSATDSLSYANAPWPASQTGAKTAGHGPKPSISKTPALSIPEEGSPARPLVQTEDAWQSRPGSPSVSRPSLRKNFSSSSLRSLRGRNLSVSHADDASDVSPSTPNNQHGSRVPAVPTMPTPLSSAFRTGTGASVVVGPQIFNTINLPNSPGSPSPLTPDSPVPLEPCPTEYTLRPFWLMRCLYQTLCHPRGGYVTSRLFVPRDVWKVKGVKLKNVEDKIINCDILTAALERLGRVDTCDADAVLDEMQTVEGVLEQVQAALSRKLGQEVGIQGASLLLKEATSHDADPAGTVPRSTSVSARSSSFSWRRLRSKNSGIGLNSGAYAPKATPVDGPKDSLTMTSLPMTSHPVIRPAKRDLQSMQFTGPNAAYMSCLAQLFDAAQTIDQVARQVEDPGLRHANKTQVGLELCTRHAAEFFSFYICRFVIADMSLLMDKFVKRGTEWVLI